MANLCSGNSKNMGVPNCYSIADLIGKLVFTSTVADDGTYNSILVADTVDSTYLTGMVQTGDKTNVSITPDYSKQWFVTPLIKEYNPERADDNTFDSDGFSYSASQGVRTISFRIIDGASPQMLEALESFTKKKTSVYSISTSGQIVGNGKNEAYLAPFRIETNTWQLKYMEESKVNNSPAYIDVTFALADTERDRNIAHFDEGAGVLAEGANALDLEGLIDVVMQPATSITATTFTVDMNLIYGSFGNLNKFKGAVAADFLFDGVAPTTVTESADGVYDFVVPTFSGTQVLSFFKEKFSASQINVTL